MRLDHHPEMDDCELTKELLAEILAKLPVKSLFRFKCVCKYFYALINNNYQFFHKFYEINREKCDCAIIEMACGYDGSPNKLFNLLYKESESDEIDCIHVEFPNSFVRLVSVCDGMLCFILDNCVFDMRESIFVGEGVLDVILWNPFIREIKTLPSLNVPYSNFRVTHKCVMFDGLGFGFSNRSMTWKVVVLWHAEDLAKNTTYELVMVCSQSRDGSWSWKQIDAAPNVPMSSQGDFYFNGKYYWRVEIIGRLDLELPFSEERLLWFDFDDEVFGTIHLPTRCEDLSFTVMNQTIAMISRCPPENSNCIEVWLMSETANNVDWHKQWSIECGASIDKHESWNPVPCGNWEESWLPIGIWNNRGRFRLLVLPHIIEHERRRDYRDYPDAENYVPYLISVDLETQEREMIYLTQNKKRVELISDSTGYAQVYKESTIVITQDWKDKIFPRDSTSARILNQSLTFV